MNIKNIINDKQMIVFETESMQGRYNIYLEFVSFSLFLQKTLIGGTLLID